MTSQMHLIMFITHIVVGSGTWFLFTNRPLTAIFMVLMGIFMILIQILIALKNR